MQLKDSRFNREMLFELFLSLENSAVHTDVIPERQGKEIPFDFASMLQSRLGDCLPRQVSPNLRWRSYRGRSVLDDEQWGCAVALFEELWDQARSHRAFTLENNSVPRPMQWCIVHAPAFEALAQLGDDQAKARQDPSAAAVLQASLEQRLREEFLPDMAEADASFRAFLETTLSDKLLGALRRVGDYEATGYSWERATCVRVGEALCKQLEPLWREGLSIGRDESEALRETISPLMPLLVFRQFLFGLDQLNLQLLPVASGGQDDCNEAGNRFARFVSDVATQISAQKTQTSAGSIRPGQPPTQWPLQSRR